MRGNSFNFIQIAINSSLGFYVRYAGYWATFENYRRESKISKYLKTGAIITGSHIILEALFFPFSRLRTIAYLSYERKIKFGRLSLSILRCEKLNGLYKGFSFWIGGLLLQNVSFMGLLYLASTTFNFNQFTSSIIGAMITSALVYPTETVVRRYQADGAFEAAWYDSPKRVALQILSKEGWKGFYKGFSLYLPTNIFGVLTMLAVFKQFSLDHRIF